MTASMSNLSTLAQEDERFLELEEEGYEVEEDSALQEDDTAINGTILNLFLSDF